MVLHGITWEKSFEAYSIDSDNIETANQLYKVKSHLLPLRN